MGGGWLAAHAAAAALGLAAVNQDSVTLRTYGLTGNWAVECREAASADNPHITFAVPADRYPEYIERTGTGAEQVAAVSNVRAIANGQVGMTFTVTVNSGGTTTRAVSETVIAKTGGKFRFLEIRTDGGALPISGGVVKATGKATAWIQKCGE